MQFLSDSPTTMIVFTLSVVVPQSRHGDFMRGMGAFLEPTRVAPGCINCRLLGDFEDGDSITLVEEWASQEELDRHLVSDAFRTLVALIEMSARPPLIRFDTVEQSAGIEVIEKARRALGFL